MATPVDLLTLFMKLLEALLEEFVHFFAMLYHVYRNARAQVLLLLVYVRIFRDILHETV